MKRITEPELMSDEDQAIAYANADFEEPHNHFISLLKNTLADVLPDNGIAMDLGCGAADISIRLAKVFPNYRIDAFDGSEAMLAEAEKALHKSKLNDRINLIHTCLEEKTLSDKGYDLIFSNSLLHHLHEPLLLWNCIKNAKGRPPVFIMDLMRPESEDEVSRMVKEYAAGEPEILQRDFYNSLKAAFTLDEVKQQLREAGLTGFVVSIVSDRHLIIVKK